MKSARPDGAIWTIEQSRKTGALHCNIITPASASGTTPHATQWNQLIAGDVRAVGAYIAKQSQMPREEDYKGRLYGTAGQLWQILTSQTLSPVAAAAAAQYAIDSHKMIHRAAHLKMSQSQQNQFKWAQQDCEAAAKRDMTPEQAREIAAKWLPDLLEWKEKIRPKNSLELAREFMKREGT